MRSRVVAAAGFLEWLRRYIGNGFHFWRYFVDEASEWLRRYIGNGFHYEFARRYTTERIN